MVEAGTSNNAIEIGLRRAQGGIKITVKVWPEVEAFFERWSGGLYEKPSHGRLWKPLKDSELTPLWSLGISTLAPGPTRPFSLLHTGCGLITDAGHPNISFLRMVGASRAEQSFLIEAVISRGELTQMGQRLSEASHMFYQEYLQPVNIRAFVGVDRLPNAA